MKAKLKDQIINAVTRYDLFRPGDSVLVAVSGGADSVCLLSLFMSLKDEWDLTVSVAHLNHMLRGAESDRDEDFVRNLCEKYSIPFHCKKCDIRRIAKEQRCSLEEAGRNARYAFFAELQKQYGIDKVATAHNMNDNVETVCMRFMRGTSLRGLSGIPIKNSFGVIRPLLFTKRCEIEEYLTMHKLSYVTDSTNDENDFTRNKIRNCLIPYICSEFNENFIHTVSNNLELFHETELFLEKNTEKAYRDFVQHEYFGVFMLSEQLTALEPIIAMRLIQKMAEKVSGHSVTSDITKQIYQMASEKEKSRMDIHKNLSVYLCYGKMYFVNPLSLSNAEYTLNITHSSGVIKHNKTVLLLPKEIDTSKLEIRMRKPGDNMYLGKCGHKKIKDILIDEKIPVFLRDTIPVVLYENEIIWLCGIRDNPSFRPSSYDSYLKLTYTKENKHA